MPSNTIISFFGSRAEADGSIGLGCLSQWWVAPFQFRSHEFASAEHSMMYGKAIVFNDRETAQKILPAATPREAKALGRQVRNFDPDIWDHRSFDIVRDGNLAKFSAHPRLREFLLATGDSLLVEANPYDRIWGAGLSVHDPRIQKPRLWRGQNRLGIALMDVRRILLSTV